MQFGNDKSRIIRGLAIILMVTGHTMPGKIIPFAVPLFSFLVGYGYEFAKAKNLCHAAKRIWHLLAHFWFILLGICLPIAVFYTHYAVSLNNLVLNMFGMWGGLNYYCWYVNFYILAMLTMPLLSRIIDRYGLKGLLPLMIFFGVGYWALEYVHALSTNPIASRFNRYFKLMPIVLAAYWMAHYKIFSRINLKAGKKMIAPALLGMAAFYMFRGIPYAKIADFAVTPLFVGSVALLIDSVDTLSARVVRIFGYVKMALTDLGIKSMNIWFLHALFFTASTKTLFKFMTPLYVTPIVKVLVILCASWLLSTIVMKLYDLLASSLAKLGSTLGALCRATLLR